MNRLLTKYQQQVTERPLRTFACQSGTMFTIGDLVAQQAIEMKGNEHDAARTLRMGIYGFCIGGPMVGSWFTFLNNAIKIQHRVKGALVRLAIDQTCFTPTLNAVFLTSVSLLEGRTFAEIKEKFRTSYFTAVCNSYRLWPFVNLFGFLFIHPPYRPLTNSVIAIGWNAYLSYLNQQALKTSSPAEASALASSRVLQQQIQEEHLNNTNALSSNDTSTIEQTQQQQVIG